MGFGIELFAAIIASFLGGLLPLLRDFIKRHIQKAKAKGFINERNKFLAKLFNISIDEPISYKERLTKTLEALKKAFEETDKATVEFSELMKEKNIDMLEIRLSELASEETALKSKVESLQKVPLEALTHFEHILNKGDKRSAYRDYALFVSGVVLSVLVTIVLRLFFGI